jgi:hypothetical protein
MMGFEYPIELHTRRHGPTGYESYESYRDWLRDEFTFRCVYCLHRERWYGRGATFHIDHFSPQSDDPGGRCDYENLLYACATCNEAKKAILGIPNPCAVSFGDCLRILPDGHIEALNGDGEKIRQSLRLDSESNVRYRSRWMRVLETLQMINPVLYQEFMGFPEDLPNLQKKRVPNNTKPEGATNCYFALRERGVLPVTY